MPGIGRLKGLDLSQQFMVVSLLVLLANMAAIGWWIGHEIEQGVLRRTAATTALYVDSFIEPLIPELADQEQLSPEHMDRLGRLLQDTALGQYVVSFKLWSPSGRVLYSEDPSTVGQVFPPSPGLERALRSEVASDISDLSEQENVSERDRYSRLLETYSPVLLPGTNKLVAVAEFYTPTEALDQDIAAARWRSWLIVALATVLMYASLVGLVHRGNETIKRQQRELNDQLAYLTAVMGQNQELHERVQRAATKTTEINEKFLRRISAELHDGPAQDLALALLRLDSKELQASVGSDGPDAKNRELEQIGASIQRALQELRAISAGLRLPELESLSLTDTVVRVVETHERRTKSHVLLETPDLPDQVALPIKITVYRLVQEALSNAYRHAKGLGQFVRVVADGADLVVQIGDTGPGFDSVPAGSADSHLGIVGMRERVESLGGRFSLESGPGFGTRVTARLPLGGQE